MIPRSQTGCLLSVLIPAYNESRFIERAIRSTNGAMAAAGVSAYEIIVCDNNSNDETGKLAREAGARVVFEPHNQIARARNAAARSAQGEWLIFVDADSVLSGDLVKATLRRIEGERVVGGGALIAFDRDDLGWHVTFGLRFWSAISRGLRWAAGSFIFCRREAWEETGGFPEAWYAGEEIAFSRNLKRWCRNRALGFVIITEERLQTSSRKVDNYSIWQMARLLMGLACPGALKSRARCHYWYDRKS